MSWKGGTAIIQDVTEILVREVPEFEKRQRIWEKLINSCEDEDWCAYPSASNDPAYAAAYLKLHPET